MAPLFAQTNSPSLVGSGFSSPSGLALGPGQELLVSDSAAGTLYRITTNGIIAVEAYGFIQPQGVLADKQGRKYVADNAAGTVYRMEANGAITVLAENLRNPCCLGFDSEGNVLVSHDVSDQRSAVSGQRSAVSTAVPFRA